MLGIGFFNVKIYSMKNYFIVLICVFSWRITTAQDITDALRYSQDRPTGTARFSAMSGAFGALGGDLSAISKNPAGSVIFANNQVAFTLSNNFIKNNSNYFGSTTSDSKNSIDLNQAGGVFVFENNDASSDWKKFALAMNYEKLNNFNNSIYSNGINNTSIGEYFKQYANQDSGISVNSLIIPSNSSLTDLYSNYNFADQQALLGYQAYIIDVTPDYDEATKRTYMSLVAPGGGYFQENIVTSTGYNGKISFNGSAQYLDKLSIGINLNAHFTDYVRASEFFERNDNNNTTTDLVKRVYFNNNLHTYGNGFSLQLGGIYKVTPEFRLGVAYESPTWMKLNDELSQSLKAVSGSTNGELPADVADPNITIVYDPYTLKTPDKWTFSSAFVFGKQGLISVDYSLKNYSTISFKPEKDFKGLNANIPKVLTNSKEFRIGAEHKIKQWSLRGGYHFEGSPYADKSLMSDLKGYSGGFGYNFGGTKLDFAFSTSQRTYGEQFFNVGMTDRAKIDVRNNNFTVSLAFEL